ncbi:hypothetical protein USB125703_01491 [Pseudoclavibacter triregionum]|nr:hypothetical protein USB125703_01491 [Pseudoclavibacter triregionum]
MIGTLELGLLYAVVAFGVYLTFRVLDFPDLTVDGSFTTGGAVAASLIVGGVNPVLATLAAAGAGALAGCVTALLHTKGKIDGLLSGILTMIALWSINLHIMGKSNLPMLRLDTVFTPLQDARIMGTWTSVALLAVGAIILKLVIDWFLSTDLGLSIQATGNNEQMIRSFGVDTHGTTILTLALSNALVAAGGALLAQYQGFADISMGVGLILVGLASVIIGQAIFGNSKVFWATLGVLAGAVLYRLIIFGALQMKLDPNDVKIISAIVVVAALLLPRWGLFKNLTRKRVVPAPPAHMLAVPDDEGASMAAEKGHTVGIDLPALDETGRATGPAAGGATATQEGR